MWSLNEAPCRSCVVPFPWLNFELLTTNNSLTHCSDNCWSPQCRNIWKVKGGHGIARFSLTEGVWPLYSVVLLIMRRMYRTVRVTCLDIYNIRVEDASLIGVVPPRREARSGTRRNSGRFIFNCKRVHQRRGSIFLYVPYPNNTVAFRSAAGGVR